ncbi:hypothetical protein F2P56_001512 [Juglans regia]|uniref:Reverse transcriptase domain-containing protein n=2 Tax=Juglans regia TaxID=51240 RepID=A0A833YDV5_JUGRE|nr:uncharacterized protein LOC109013285 [Juglans regia]KAF5480799.1 hypothetical protein F2P56_001512 [Juglans regia]
MVVQRVSSQALGLRQEDPLSPLLFVIVMEALSRMILALVTNGSISGFQIGSPNRGNTTISHLLFAYDTLIMCEADQAQLRVVKALLLCFEVVSGLKVNYDKFEFVPIGKVQDIRELAGILSCKIAYLPMTYLGFLLGIAPSTKDATVAEIMEVSGRNIHWNINFNRAAQE